MGKINRHFIAAQVNNATADTGYKSTMKSIAIAHTEKIPKHSP